VSEQFGESGQEYSENANARTGAVLIGGGVALAILLWRLLKGRVPRRLGRQKIWPVRIVLGGNGKVINYPRVINIHIRPGDERQHVIRWIVGNELGPVLRKVKFGNVRVGSKSGRGIDLFEPGTDEGAIPGWKENSIYSPLLPDVADGSYFYDILVDGKIAIDPEIAIRRY
jgi:hypothetical protein